MSTNMVIFSGNANKPLAEKLANHLAVPLGNAVIDCFSDREVRIELTENVRGSEAFIVQSTNPPAENLMELVLMADALRRASAVNITAVIPYYGYARQDRRPRSARVPISARVVADMLSSAGVNRVLTVDLHSDQIQGFFCMPVDNVYSLPVMIEDIKQRASSNLRIISPDVGGVVRARAYTKHLPNSDLAIIDKRRPKPNESRVMHIIGDVEGADCIIVDDIVDTAGTLCQAVAALKTRGAKSVSAYITHPVLSGPALDNIEQSELDELVVADTLCLSERAQQCSRIRQVSIAESLAQSIICVHQRQSLSSLFL